MTLQTVNTLTFMIKTQTLFIIILQCETLFINLFILFIVTTFTQTHIVFSYRKVGHHKNDIPILFVCPPYVLLPRLPSLLRMTMTKLLPVTRTGSRTGSGRTFKRPGHYFVYRSFVQPATNTLC